MEKDYHRRLRNANGLFLLTFTPARFFYVMTSWLIENAFLFSRHQPLGPAFIVPGVPNTVWLLFPQLISILASSLLLTLTFSHQLPHVRIPFLNYVPILLVLVTAALVLIFFLSPPPL